MPHLSTQGILMTVKLAYNWDTFKKNWQIGRLFKMEELIKVIFLKENCIYILGGEI